jgi:type I restriction enzyme S subunit
MAETLNSKNQQPSVWKNCRVEDFCTTASGGTPLTTRRDYYDDGHIPWLRSGEVSQGRVRHAEISITQPGLDNSSAKLFKKGTILVAMYGATAGEVGILEFESSTNQAVCGITPGPSVDGEFLFQALLLRKPALIKMAGGGAQPNISQEIIRNFKIPLPPLAEQRKIAEMLRTWDEAIETTEAELKAKQERKRGMMQKLLSPGRQIKRKAGNSFNESVRRFELTNGWSWMFIHEVSKLSYSSVDKKSVEGEKSVRLCNYMDVFYNRRIREGMPFMKSTASDSDIKKFTLSQGDVVLTKDSETPEEIAFAAVIDEQIDNLVCGYHLAVLRPDKAKVTGEYLMSAINFHPNHHQFVRLANGATRFGLGIDSLNNAVIPIPPLEEQRKIAEILQNADAGIEVINNRIEALRTQKRGLMQKLLTGEVRVAA